MSYTGLYIAIDFDGTCVTHEFPDVGKEIDAVPILKKLIEILIDKKYQIGVLILKVIQQNLQER